MLNVCTSSPLLLHDEMLQVKPQLALLLGLEEALVLQYISSWLDRHSRKRDDGHYWTVLSDVHWLRDFVFFPWPKTHWDVIDRLMKRGLIAVEECPTSGDPTKCWYRVEYTALEALRVARGVSARFYDDEVEEEALR